MGWIVTSYHIPFLCASPTCNHCTTITIDRGLCDGLATVRHLLDNGFGVDPWLFSSWQIFSKCIYWLIKSYLKSLIFSWFTTAQGCISKLLQFKTSYEDMHNALSEEIVRRRPGGYLEEFERIISFLQVTLQFQDGNTFPWTQIDKIVIVPGSCEQGEKSCSSFIL